MRRDSKVNPWEAKRIARQKYAERQIEKFVKWSWEIRGKVKYSELIELQNDLMAYIVPQSMSCGILHRFLLMNTYDYLSKPHTIPIIDKAWVVYGMIDGRSKSDEPGGLLVDLLQTRCNWNSRNVTRYSWYSRNCLCTRTTMSSSC